MLVAQRRNLIARMVTDLGSVKVKDLSRQFALTKDCIRKDLRVLQRAGLVKKIYGGAVKVNSLDDERYVAQRKGKHLDEKLLIAQKAARLLKDGSVIFLDISTTNIELAKLIKNSDLSLTVMTNMIDVMQIMTEDNHDKLIFIGGEFSDDKSGFVGSLTAQEIQRYNFDAAFIGASGVDGGKVLTFTPEDAETKQAIVRNSRKNILLLETRKLTRRGECSFANLADFDGIIFEKSLDDTQRAQLINFSGKIL